MATAQANVDDETTVVLQSGDGREFKISVKVAKVSTMVRTMLEDLGTVDDGDLIPLANVCGEVLEQVVRWMQQHKDDPIGDPEPQGAVGGDGDVPVSDDEPGQNLDFLPAKERERLGLVPIPEWDKQFLDVDKKMLLALTLASNYLDMPRLLDMTTYTIAEKYIMGRTPEEIRGFFNLKNDVEVLMRGR